MSKAMRLSLRAGETVYINGAVLRADRKVTIELLNDATFLLPGHVIQPAEADTPLRQLYFVVQTMLIEPAQTPMAREIFDRMIGPLRRAFRNRDVLAGLDDVEALVVADRIFEALKSIRSLLPIEAAILAQGSITQTRAA